MSFTFPQGIDSLLAFFPRPVLDQLEIHANPTPVHAAELESCLSFWRERRVAFVKQSSYHALYQPGKFPSWESRAWSSSGHMGALALLADLHADFYVVRQDEAPETRLWETKYTFCPNPQERAAERNLWAHELEEKHGSPTIPSPREIDWGIYDLVVCIDIPVAAETVARFPNPVWAYYISEPGMPAHKQSLKEPLFGYDLFLNHGFRRFRARPWNRWHVLEFPYSFQSRNAWEKLLAHGGLRDLPRSGVLVDGPSWDESPPDPGQADRLKGDLKEVLHAMATHAIAIRTAQFPRWGNWQIEAVLAGCLFLADPKPLAQISGLLPETICSNLAAGLKLAVPLLENPAALEILWNKQAEVVEEVSFRRPLVELTSRVHQLRLSP